MQIFVGVRATSKRAVANLVRGSRFAVPTRPFTKHKQSPGQRQETVTPTCHMRETTVLIDNYCALEPYQCVPPPGRDTSALSLSGIMTRPHYEACRDSAARVAGATQRASLCSLLRGPKGPQSLRPPQRLVGARMKSTAAFERAGHRHTSAVTEQIHQTWGQERDLRRALGTKRRRRACKPSRGT